MFTEHGLSSHLSQIMDTCTIAIRRWIEQYEAEQQGQTGIGTHLTAEKQRIRQLQQENGRLRSDVDVLEGHRPYLPRAQVSYRVVDELQTRAVMWHKPAAISV